MKKEILYPLFLFYIFFLLSGSLYGAGEKIMVIGAASTWNMMEKRNGVTEVPAVRPQPVLVLSSAQPAKSGESGGIYPGSSQEGPDLTLSFDEEGPGLFADPSGRYQVQVSTAALATGALSSVERRWARAGTGAVLFSGALENGNALVIVPGEEALFAPGQYIRDFSIEFWLYPLNMENGEQVLAWTASRPDGGGNFIFQRILCEAVRNRLQWTFNNFFFIPGKNEGINFSVSGAPVLPKTWSHHLIRFDADTGLLEYLMNGRLEDLAYVSSTRREGGEVYTPVIGEQGRFIPGGRFTGLMDEFKIYRRYAADPDLAKYPPQGGRAETRTLDLGEGNSAILRVEAAGGTTTVTGGSIQNKYAGQGELRFLDDSELRFFIRAADTPYNWAESSWLPFIPGTELSSLKGRFVQVAVEFYPSGDGETSPYLAEIRIIYRRDDPPVPPSYIAAVASDGAVELSWKAGADMDLAGYLVYYGTSKGEYFGDHAILGPSPVNVGKRTSVYIDGLKNGTLYYFAVAAYDHGGPLHLGEFSREVTARPLTGLTARPLRMVE
jgi:hypothetical protein